MAAGQAVAMGYNNVYWYKEGLAGWKKGHNLLESLNFRYAHRKLPEPIEPRALAEKLRSNPRYLLVDIRDTKSRQKDGLIDGPTEVLPLFRFHTDYEQLPDDKILVIYDIRAKQAPAAIRYLLEKKYYFINLTYLKGGISAWKAEGLPVKAF
jgi:rhodanese-related sulfurtransferase